MKWTILNTLICPQSGIAFSAISSLRFLKFIMWYEADVILLPGESMKLYSSRVLRKVRISPRCEIIVL